MALRQIGLALVLLLGLAACQDRPRTLSPPLTYEPPTPPTGTIVVQ